MKKLLCALLAVIMLLSLCACHGKGVQKPAPEEAPVSAETASPDENPEASEEAAPVAASAAIEVGELDPNKHYEIVFWAKNDTNKAQTNIYEKAAADFEALYPNIHVNIRLYTDYGKIYNDVITNIATNTTPNVCITYPDHIATYITGDNIVVPLESFIRDEEYGLGGSALLFDSPSEEEVVPQFLSECYIDGVCYALPYMRSTEACYINKTYVEKLGYELPEALTWDFVWEVSEAAMAKNADGTFAVNGQNVMIPFIYKSTDNMMIQMLRQLGAGYSDPDGTVKIFNDTTKELLYTIAEHAGNRSFSTFKISSYPANFLNAGQCIFAIDSTAGATWMGTDAPLLDISADQIVEFETVVMTIPQFDPADPQMISQGPSVCVFNKKDSGEVLASWLFTQYLLTNDVQIAYSETEGYVPVTTKAQQSGEYQDYLSRSGEDCAAHYYVKIESSRLLLANTGNTFTTPVFNGSASLRDAAGQMIENVCKSMRRNETVDEAYMDKLYDSVISMYHLNQNGLKIEGMSTAPVQNAPSGNPENPSSGSQQSPNDGKDLGPLPGTAVALLVSLVSVWVLLGAYVLIKTLKKRKNGEKS